MSREVGSVLMRSCDTLVVPSGCLTSTTGAALVTVIDSSTVPIFSFMSIVAAKPAATRMSARVTV